MPSMCCLRTALTAAVIFASAVLTAEATAGTTTNNLLVTATVANSCAINSATALAFGTYDPVGANSASVGTDLTANNGLLTITCTRSASTTITLGQGINPANGSTDTAPLRQMKLGNYVLAYTLYQDAGHTSDWGNTLGTAVQRIASGGPDSITVYGVVPRGQSVPAGSYTDIVVVTVTF